MIDRGGYGWPLPMPSLHAIQPTHFEYCEHGKVNEDDGEQNEDMVCDGLGFDAGMCRPV